MSSCSMFEESRRSILRTSPLLMFMTIVVVVMLMAETASAFRFVNKFELNSTVPAFSSAMVPEFRQGNCFLGEVIMTIEQCRASPTSTDTAPRRLDVTNLEGFGCSIEVIGKQSASGCELAALQLTINAVSLESGYVVLRNLHLHGPSSFVRITNSNISLERTSGYISSSTGTSITAPFALDYLDMTDGATIEVLNSSVVYDLDGAQSSEDASCISFNGASVTIDSRSTLTIYDVRLRFTSVDMLTLVDATTWAGIAFRMDDFFVKNGAVLNLTVLAFRNSAIVASGLPDVAASDQIFAVAFFAYNLLVSQESLLSISGIITGGGSSSSNNNNALQFVDCVIDVRDNSVFSVTDVTSRGGLVLVEFVLVFVSGGSSWLFSDFRVGMFHILDGNMIFVSDGSNMTFTHMEITLEEAPHETAGGTMLSSVDVMDTSLEVSNHSRFVMSHWNCQQDRTAAVSTGSAGGIDNSYSVVVALQGSSLTATESSEIVVAGLSANTVEPWGTAVGIQVVEFNLTAENSSVVLIEDAFVSFRGVSGGYGVFVSGCVFAAKNESELILANVTIDLVSTGGDNHLMGIVFYGGSFIVSTNSSLCLLAYPPDHKHQNRPLLLREGDPPPPSSTASVITLHRSAVSQFATVAISLGSMSVVVTERSLLAIGSSTDGALHVSVTSLETMPVHGIRVLSTIVNVQSWSRMEIAAYSSNIGSQGDATMFELGGQNSRITIEDNSSLRLLLALSSRITAASGHASWVKLHGAIISLGSFSNMSIAGGGSASSFNTTDGGGVKLIGTNATAVTMQSSTLQCARHSTFEIGGTGGGLLVVHVSGEEEVMGIQFMQLIVLKEGSFIHVRNVSLLAPTTAAATTARTPSHHFTGVFISPTSPGDSDAPAGFVALVDQSAISLSGLHIAAGSTGGSVLGIAIGAAVVGSSRVELRDTSIDANSNSAPARRRVIGIQFSVASKEAAVVVHNVSIAINATTSAREEEETAKLSSSAYPIFVGTSDFANTNWSVTDVSAAVALGVPSSSSATSTSASIGVAALVVFSESFFTDGGRLSVVDATLNEEIYYSYNNDDASSSSGEEVNSGAVLRIVGGLLSFAGGSSVSNRTLVELVGNTATVVVLPNGNSQQTPRMVMVKQQYALVIIDLLFASAKNSTTAAVAVAATLLDGQWIIAGNAMQLTATFAAPAAVEATAIFVVAATEAAVGGGGVLMNVAGTADITIARNVVPRGSWILAIATSSYSSASGPSSSESVVSVNPGAAILLYCNLGAPSGGRFVSTGSQRTMVAVMVVNAATGETAPVVAPAVLLSYSNMFPTWTDGSPTAGTAGTGVLRFVPCTPSCSLGCRQHQELPPIAAGRKGTKLTASTAAMSVLPLLGVDHLLTPRAISSNLSLSTSDSGGGICECSCRGGSTARPFFCREITMSETLSEPTQTLSAPPPTRSTSESLNQTSPTSSATESVSGNGGFWNEGSYSETVSVASPTGSVSAPFSGTRSNPSPSSSVTASVGAPTVTASVSATGRTATLSEQCFRHRQAIPRLLEGSNLLFTLAAAAAAQTAASGPGSGSGSGGGGEQQQQPPLPLALDPAAPVVPLQKVDAESFRHSSTHLSSAATHREEDGEQTGGIDEFDVGLRLRSAPLQLPATLYAMLVEATTASTHGRAGGGGGTAAAGGVVDVSFPCTLQFLRPHGVKPSVDGFDRFAASTKVRAVIRGGQKEKEEERSAVPLTSSSEDNIDKQSGRRSDQIAVVVLDLDVGVVPGLRLDSDESISFAASLAHIFPAALFPWCDVGGGNNGGEVVDAELLATPPVTLAALLVEADPDKSARRNQAAVQAVAAVTQFATVAGGTGGANSDMQALAILGLMSCAGSYERRSLSSYRTPHCLRCMPRMPKAVCRVCHCMPRMPNFPKLYAAYVTVLSFLRSAMNQVLIETVERMLCP